MRKRNPGAGLKRSDIGKIDFEKSGGLVPAVVQDNATGRVLMLGYMNREALTRTLKDRRVTFWSRSRDCLWQKGETSGNYLELVSVLPDCDNDSLLVRAIPHGPTCHTGRESCFGETAAGAGSAGFLDRLYRLIAERRELMPAGSYTTGLFRAGRGQIIGKVLEETVEVCHAAEKETDKRLAEETADLLFHLMVLLVEREVPLSRAIAELEQRRAVGGK